MRSAIPGLSRAERAAVNITLMLTMLLAAMGTSIANVSLPTLAEAFTAPFGQVQQVVTAYLAGMTVTVLIAGRLGDRYGMRPMLIVGLGLFAAVSALCAMAPHLWLLTGARALQGIGAAFLMTLGMALMRQTAEETRIGRAMGLLGTVSAMGTALGPSLGGLLIPLTGWRGIFWVQVPLATLALLLAMIWLPRQSGCKAPAATRRWSMPGPDLLTNLFINLLVAAVMMATLVAGPFHLGPGLGLSTTEIGLVMTAGPVISICTGAPAGRLVDHLGSGHVLHAGLILLATGAMLLALLPGWPGYLMAICVLTPGYQLFQAANNTAALTDVPADRRGTVSGLLNLSRNIGLIIGATVLGALFTYGTGFANPTEAAPAAIAAGMRLTFLTASGMMITAVLLARRRHAPG